MSIILPTIKVADSNPRGWKIINKSDFNPKAHRAYNAPAPTREEVEAEASEEMTEERLDTFLKDELVKLLEAHGASTEGRKDVLRERLRSLLFPKL